MLLVYKTHARLTINWNARVSASDKSYMTLKIESLSLVGDDLVLIYERVIL